MRSADEFCLVAILGERVIGGARFVHLGDPVAAEIAVTVHDDFQKQGLGTALLQHLIPIVRRRNIRRLVGELPSDNQAVVSLLCRFGPLRVSRTEPGVRHLELGIRDLL